VLPVTTLTFSFTALPTSVGANGVAKLAWTTTGAASCTVSPGGSTALSGSAYVVVPATQTFSLVATESGTGRIVEQQQTVTVDPAIVPTSTVSFVGQDGPPGAAGRIPILGTGGTDGENGWPGGPANPGGGPQTIEFGPLDLTSSPSMVVQIVNAGGNGGHGGIGANGGNGGNGGDAADLTFQFGAMTNPQQVIYTDRGGGRGGPGGSAVGGVPGGQDGTAGRNGKPGSLTMVDVT
jgi:hypothetical protein